MFKAQEDIIPEYQEHLNYTECLILILLVLMTALLFYQDRKHTKDYDFLMKQTQSEYETIWDELERQDSLHLKIHQHDN